ncbi:MAG: tRNA (guanosine(46)-N7)-methyltransferase TrmB [Xanthomonadales bacterium]|nr:tRNA (guanosine(46)-N7)-methyltransferase TrmB [Xanthomonadales bacterium]
MRENSKQGRRPVRSYVLRQGRLTDAQARALEELWPRYGIDEDADTIDLEALFGRQAPLVVEIGFGDGAATWRMATAEPEKNFIGIEVHQPGVGRLLQALEREGIDNVRIACTDAVTFMRERVGAGTLSELRIYFPDPWPKKRHHKRRIVQREFLDLVSVRMQAGGILHLATDWEPYAEHMLETLTPHPAFENLSPTGDWCPRPAWRPETKYERRGDRLGHRSFDLLFRRSDD